MLELKTRKELAQDAHTLAVGYQFVRYHSNTYAPVDFIDRELGSVPDADRTIWVPLTRSRLQRLAADQFKTMFASDSELRNFDFMVAQSASHVDTARDAVLVRTEDGLCELGPTGLLSKVSGEFVPNFLIPMLNEKEDDKAQVYSVLSNWVGGDDNAEALLSHLATLLAPGYSAVKYVLFLGSGRNGKGLLIKMLLRLLGADNVSHVTRQYISELNPTTVDVNGKLLNLVFDGPSDYIKDSGPEKTLIAGEPLSIKMLYESHPTIVQTNALFVESLNQEPKARDKSAALQKRLVRFWFNNVFELDYAFEDQMLSDEFLGAFLALLVERYVVKKDLATRLAPSKQNVELEQEYRLQNSLALQFLQHLDSNNKESVETLLLGMEMDELAEAFIAWRSNSKDGDWSVGDVTQLFSPHLETHRKTVRTEVGPRKRRVVVSVKDDTLSFLATLREGSYDEESMVADL